MSRSTEGYPAGSTQVSEETVVNDYVRKVNDAKQKIIDNMSKQDMANLIFKQNRILAQQSSQMLDIINMANSIESNVRLDAEKKCDQKCSQPNNQTNNQPNTTNQYNKSIYENAMKTHLILFALLIIVLCWLMYHYSSTK